MANGYFVVPSIIPGGLTVGGPLTISNGQLQTGGAATPLALLNDVLQVGVASPFARLFKTATPNLGLAYNIGRDELTRDNAALGAAELRLADVLDLQGWKFFNTAGTALFEGFDNSFAQDGIAVTNTGNITENTVKSKVIPANLLGANGSLVVELLLGVSAQGAIATTFRVRFGGVIVASFTTAVLSAIHLRVALFALNATNSQFSKGRTINDAGTVVEAGLATTVDTTLDQTLAITIQNGTATDNWAVDGWRVHALASRTTAL